MITDTVVLAVESAEFAGLETESSPGIESPIQATGDLVDPRDVKFRKE